ncbi:hypothetical protein CCACVL1_04221 [Corchorus capsularis]|uniref:Uncharacterized protein n=1 Tax=Corchorus capsularis TaxID=210143 RepID=A0A1R3JUB2_COCAP|nr:hypothetical protein CCACVL1_04221 [Corchorus capsularis]
MFLRLRDTQKLRNSARVCQVDVLATVKRIIGHRGNVLADLEQAEVDYERLQFDFLGLLQRLSAYDEIFLTATAECRVMRRMLAAMKEDLNFKWKGRLVNQCSTFGEQRRVNKIVQRFKSLRRCEAKRMNFLFSSLS